MASNVTLFPTGGKISSKFASQPIENDLGAGIQSGFGLIGYRGKVWSTRYKGEERHIMRPDGDGPANSITAVILRAPHVVSKIFYEGGYTEGANAAPDCYSTNGVTPAADAPKKQSQTCALCPKNAWGSRMTEAGKKGKACSDSKRLAVVPGNPGSNDPGTLRNEMYGGPMLLRVPAASLSELQVYGERLKAAGYPYYAVLTRISFAVNEAYPKFVFEPLRPLTDDEADVVNELRTLPLVDRILSEDVTHAETPVQQPSIFIQPPAQPVVPAGVASAPQAPVVVSQPVVPAQAAPTQPVRPAPAVAPATNGAAGAAAPAAPTAQVPADREARLDALLA